MAMVVTFEYGQKYRHKSNIHTTYNHRHIQANEFFNSKIDKFPDTVIIIYTVRYSLLYEWGLRNESRIWIPYEVAWRLDNTTH